MQQIILEAVSGHGTVVSRAVPVLTEREEKASVAIASNESFSKAHMFAATCARRYLELHAFSVTESMRPWGGRLFTRLADT
jgi:hypothetical protein